MLDLPFTFQHRPANPAVRHPWLLVLMHGVGSNEHDLYGLAPQIPEAFHVLSLRAPFRMGPGAFAWFDFSIEPNGERTINEAQEAQSRALLAQALPSAASQLGVAPEHVVLPAPKPVPVAVPIAAPKAVRTPRPQVQAVQESNPVPAVEDLSAARLRPRRVTVIK